MRKLLTGGGLLLALVLLLAVNIFSGQTFKSIRMDLTESNIYTLSDGTLNILKTLEEPVTLRFYLSERLAGQVPHIKSYAERVKELLEQYKRQSDGKLNVHVIDPEPFSEEEDRAVGYGLRGVPLDAGEDVLYFGLVGSNSTDDEEVIPFLSTSRETFLEYDLTKLVHTLSQRKQHVVGLITSLPVDGTPPAAAQQQRAMPGPPWTVIEQARQLFEVRRLSPDFVEIEDDVDVLLMIHPKGLGDSALYAIDQFVLRGGRALVFVDTHAEEDRSGAQGPMGMMMPGQSRRSEIDGLLDSWGLTLEQGGVVGDMQLAATVRTERDGRLMTIDYPVWMNVDAQLINAEDVVTSNLGNLTFATAGHLSPVEGASTQMVPLVQTTENAALIDPAALEFTADPQDMLRNYAPGGKALVLAARVTGSAISAFADGAPEDAGGDESEGAEDENDESAEDKDAQADSEEKPEHIAQADINVIVIADTDMLVDRFWVQVQDFLGSRLAVPTAANGSLLVNALDNLTGSSDLISVRNRGSYMRPFTKVNELRQSAELQYREKEQELITRLDEAERKLVELESTKQGDDALVLSAAQQQEIVKFRGEKLRIRKELREVRRQLRQSIEKLGGTLKFINIGLVPILIGIGGLFVGLIQMRRRKKLAVAHAR